MMVATNLSQATSSKLPKNWEQVSIGHILKLEYGRSLPAKSRVSGQYPVFGSGGQVGEHNAAITQAPAIVVGRKGSIGAVFFSEGPCWAIDTTYYLDNFPPHIFPKYIYYFLKILGLETLNRSAAIPGLSRDDVHSFQIPIPSLENPSYSLDIQRRIVARIESMLAEVRSSRELLAKVRRDCDSIINVALDQIFQKLATGYESESLAEHIEHLTSGSRGWGKYASPSNVGPLFIRVGNVGFSRLDLTNVERLNLPSNLREAERTRIASEDVLITVTGTIGRCCVVPKDLEEAYINQHTVLVRPTGDLNPRYLMWFVLSPSGGGTQTAAMQYGQTKPGLNLTNIRNLQIPVPSEIVQHQVVSYLDSVQSEVDKMLELMRCDDKTLDLLEQSILERAFRGEL